MAIGLVTIGFVAIVFDQLGFFLLSNRCSSQDYEVMLKEEDGLESLAQVSEADVPVADTEVVDEAEASGEDSGLVLTVEAEDLSALLPVNGDGRFSVTQTYGEGAEDSNLFPTVTSVLRVSLENLTMEEVAEFQLANLSCVAEENMVGPSVFASTQLTIECKLKPLFFDRFC